MPIVAVQLLEGRTHEQKIAMVEKVTVAVPEIINASFKNVKIISKRDVKKHFASAGALSERS